MLADFGLLFLILSFFFNFFQILILLYIYITNNFSKVVYIIYPLSLQLFFLFFSIIILVISFLSNDFSILYVYLNSNSSLPIIYKICALWSAHEGSFLLFMFIFVLWSLLFFIFKSKFDSKLVTIIMLILNILFLIFIVFLLFTSNPFEKIYGNLPIDGMDLNPLLQDIGLVIHPPLLYIGYAGFVIPFVFSLSVLLNRKIILNYFNFIYPWILMPFVFLTLGIVIGSWWAYYELGWGGWWFWDPVENAALIPWLSSIALIHAFSISKVRFGFFKLSLILSIATFIFCLLGIFLVRSGVINSVHAFASNNRGIYLIIILLFVFFSSIYIYIVNYKFIYRKIFLSLFSKESVLFINIIFLLVSIFIILLGTYYPSIVDLFFNKKISVGAPYFNFTVVPILCIISIFIPFGLCLKWVKNDFINKNIFYIFIFSLILGLLISYYYDKDIIIFSILGISAGIWILLGCSYYGFHKNIFRFNIIYCIRQLCLIFSHMSVGIIILGITVSSFYSIEKDISIKIGDKVNILNYDFVFNKMLKKEGSNYISDIAEFVVIKNNKELTCMYPEKRIFYISGISMTEVSIYPSLFYDLYIALGKNIGADNWSCRIYYKPFIRWIWFGGISLSLCVLINFLCGFRRFRS